MAKNVIFNDKVNGKVFNILCGKVGEHVYSITKNIKEMNNVIRWCNFHKAGDVLDCNKYRIELTNG